MQRESSSFVRPFSFPVREWRDKEKKEEYKNVVKAVTCILEGRWMLNINWGFVAKFPKNNIKT